MTQRLPPPPDRHRPHLLKRLFFLWQRVITGLAWVFFTPLLLLRLRPRRSFSVDRTPDPPDYTRSEHWAARPDAPRNSRVAPTSKASQRDPAELELDFDVFYIHPTMHLNGASWNAPLDHRRINELVDELVLPSQASAFARTCRVYAPRYRQATLYSFLGANDSCRRALELAYRDVRAAFEHYLEHDNQGRPFFLASHSQGSCHAIRLLEECIEADAEVVERMVCAYVLGYTVPRDKFEAVEQAPAPVFSRLRPSEGPSDLHCVVAWDTFGVSGGPLHSSDKAEIWYSGEAPPDVEASPSPSSAGYWRPRAGLDVLGIHPFTFDRRSGWVPREHHRGAVHIKLSARISPAGLFFQQKPLGVRMAGLSKPYPNLVAAALRSDGYLFITEPPVAAFQRAILPGRSFHNHDYSLFYCDLEANVAERAAAYLTAQQQPTQAEAG